MVVVSCEDVNKPSLDNKPIVILYDNDVHCGNDAEGYAQIAGLRSAIVDSDTAYCIIVSSGDYIYGNILGSLTSGGDIIKIMNAAQYDVVGLGNHEFDYGVDRLLELEKQMKFSIVNANVSSNLSGKNLFSPYKIIEFGKIKVAFIGVVTPDARKKAYKYFWDENADPLYSFAEDNLSQKIQTTVDEVKSLGAHYVILLSHLGEYDTDYLSTKLIAETSGIDVVLDAHTHSVIERQMVANRDGEEILMSQTGTKFENIGKLYIGKDGTISTELLPINEVKQVEYSVKSIVDSINIVLNKKLDVKIATSDVELVITDDNGNRIVRLREANIGDFVADAFKTVGGTEIGITSGAAIYTSLPKGDITRKMILNVFPYNNLIETIEVRGKYFAGYLNRCTKGVNKGEESGTFPQISGIRYTVHMNADTRVGEGDVEFYNEQSGQYEPIDPERYYTVTTSQYLVGARGEFLGDYKVLATEIGVDNEMIIKYIIENLNGHIDSRYAEPAGRVIFVQ